MEQHSRDAREQPHEALHDERVLLRLLADGLRFIKDVKVAPRLDKRDDYDEHTLETLD